MFAETVSITDAKRTLSKLASDVADLGNTIMLTKNGKPYVVIMNAEDYEGMMETAEILLDPNEVAAIKKGLEDKKDGRTRKLEELDALFD